jgi:hypothetical protein
MLLDLKLPFHLRGRQIIFDSHRKQWQNIICLSRYNVCSIISNGISYQINRGMFMIYLC